MNEILNLHNFSFILFSLQLPGFLELIVEHFRRCLIEIFGILEEYEVGTLAQKSLLEPVPNQEAEPSPEPEAECNSQSEAETAPGAEPMEEQAPDRPDEDLPVAVEPLAPVTPEKQEEVEEEITKEEGKAEEKAEEVEKEKEEEEKRAGEASENKTECKPETAELPAAVQGPRPKQASKYDKLPVKIVPKDDLMVDLTETLGPVTSFTSGLLHWQAGGGDSTAHIQTHFEPRGDPPSSASKPGAGKPDGIGGETEEAGGPASRKRITATIDDVLCARVDALSHAHPARSLPSYPFRVHPDGERDGITLLEDEPRCLDEPSLYTTSA